MMHSIGRVFYILLCPFYFLRFLIDSVLNLCGQWFLSRQWHLLVVALPSLVIAVTISAAVASGWKAKQVDTRLRYVLAHETAMANGDIRTAEFCLRKQMQLSPERPEPQFELGLLAYKSGDLAKAQSLIAPLAPVDAEGFAPAHFWVASTILNDRNTPLNAERIQTALRHMQISVRKDSRNARANQLLAELLTRTGRLEEAIPYYEVASSEFPETRLALGEYFLNRGEKDRGVRECRRAAEEFQKIVTEAPHDVQGRLRWSRSVLLTGDTQQAMEILQAGLALNGDNNDTSPDKQLLKKAAARVLVSAARANAAKGAKNFAAVAECLEQAVSYAPDDPAVTHELAFLFQSDPALAKQLRPLLVDALAAGRAPALVHAIFGTEASLQGNLKQARIHFERAVELNPSLGDVVNNLAWAWANGDDPDLEKALLLSDSAVQMKPQHAEYRETRGQILAKMQRWEDALKDLEFAVRTLHGRPELHQTLASVYEALQMTPLAQKHRELAVSTGTPQTLTPPR